MPIFTQFLDIFEPRLPLGAGGFLMELVFFSMAQIKRVTSDLCLGVMWRFGTLISVQPPNFSL
jgi:hypothetical protein